MEVKWYMIAVATIFGLGMAAATYTEFQKSQCKIAAIQAHMTPDQIEQVCK